MSSANEYLAITAGNIIPANYFYFAGVMSVPRLLSPPPIGQWHNRQLQGEECPPDNFHQEIFADIPGK